MRKMYPQKNRVVCRNFLQTVRNSNGVQIGFFVLALIFCFAYFYESMICSTAFLRI
jgi:hypothetical protein